MKNSKIKKMTLLTTFLRDKPELRKFLHF